MPSLTTARTAIPAGPWTVDDLDDFPEGTTTRYELVDGDDVRLSPARQIAPDVTVVRREDATGRQLECAPLLVVEVQSPSTRTVELVLERQVLAEASVPSYWLVDPDDGVVTVLEPVDCAYRELACGDDVTVERPFPARVRLSR